MMSSFVPIKETTYHVLQVCTPGRLINIFMLVLLLMPLGSIGVLFKERTYMGAPSFGTPPDGMSHYRCLWRNGILISNSPTGRDVTIVYCYWIGTDLSQDDTINHFDAYLCTPCGLSGWRKSVSAPPIICLPFKKQKLTMTCFHAAIKQQGHTRWIGLLRQHVYRPVRSLRPAHRLSLKNCASSRLTKMSKIGTVMH